MEWAGSIYERDRRCTGDGCGGGWVGDMDERVKNGYDGWEGGKGE